MVYKDLKGQDDKIIKNQKIDFFKIASGGRAATPGAPRDIRGPMGPHINYREERANARDEREVINYREERANARDEREDHTVASNIPCTVFPAVGVRYYFQPVSNTSKSFSVPSFLLDSLSDFRRLGRQQG